MNKKNIRTKKNDRWIEFTKTLPIDFVIDSYINEIQDITTNYELNVGIKIRNTIIEIISIYKENKNEY